MTVPGQDVPWSDYPSPGIVGRVRSPGGVRMNYRVHGLVVASPTALPLPEVGDESVDVAYRVGLESAALPAPESR